MQLKNKKFILIGFIAGLSLLFLYFLILSLANSFSHAVSQFSEMWYWILILAVGFGAQVGLYTFIREKLKTAPGKVLAASGGISTGSMVACCLHHLADVLPLMGLAAAALFLIKYQIFFLIIGILSNLIGIIIMLEIIQKNNLPQCSFLKKILAHNISRVKKLIIGLSLALILITFSLVNKSRIEKPEIGKPEIRSAAIANLPAKTNNQSGVTFEVTPLDFSFENPVKFEIKIDTHSGSLDFDLIKISTIEDDKGNKYQPLDWQGPPPGGHHLEGILIFPKLNSEVKYIKLSIRDINQNSPLIFEWSLE